MGRQLCIDDWSQKQNPQESHNNVAPWNEGQEVVPMAWNTTQCQWLGRQFCVDSTSFAFKPHKVIDVCIIGKKMCAGKSECIEVDGDRRGVVRYGKKRYLHTVHSNLGYSRHHRIGTDTACAVGRDGVVVEWHTL